MNTKFEEFKELTNYDMIDTYYDDIKDFKYFISNLQEDRVESQKYIVRANKEIKRLNNIINTFEDDLERELRISEENSGLEYKEYILIKSTLKKVLKNFRDLKDSDNNEGSI